jgi:cyclic pyranopterin phosphate synthase
MLLKSQAVALKQAGLNRITISLDTLLPERFKDLCKRDGLEQTLEGIDAGINAGFQSIKLNTVCIKGINDDEVVSLAKFAREKQIEIRFIEYMPIGANPWEKAKVMLAHEILEKIDTEVSPLVPATNYDPMAPAMEFVYEDGKGKVGIIASVSKPFCQSCNRIRITAEGKLRNCLFALEEIDIRPFLRPEVDEKSILRMLETSVISKWAGHQFNTQEFIKPLRTMHAIGG